MLSHASVCRMTVTSLPGEGNATGTCWIRYDVLERRLAEMGVADDDAARGERLGVTRHTIMRWRNRRHGVSLRTATRIAGIVGVNLDQLIEIDAGAAPPGSPPPSPPPPQPPRPTGPPSREAA